MRHLSRYPTRQRCYDNHSLFQDKRLANIKYGSLNKSERLRYKAAKKVTQHMIQLLRTRALENITSGKNSSHANWCCPLPLPLFNFLLLIVLHCVGEDLQHSLPVVSGTVNQNAGRKRSTSAEPPNLQVNPAPRPRRKACSALPANRTSSTVDGQLPTVPAYTTLLPLKASSEPATMQRQLSRPHRQGSLLEKRPITAFTYPLTTTTPAPQQVTRAPHSQWNFFSFCYECGRSSGVHLTKCPMCKAVCYCSLSCRENSWKTDHRESCTGWRGSSVGSGPRRSTAEGRRSKSGMLCMLACSCLHDSVCAQLLLRLWKHTCQIYQDNANGCLATKFS